VSGTEDTFSETTPVEVTVAVDEVTGDVGDMVMNVDESTSVPAQDWLLG